MPLPRRDFFEFLFNGGRGVRTSQLAGMQLHAAAASYDEANNRIVLLVVDLGTAELPDYALLYGRLPPTLPRKPDFLMVRAAGQGGPSIAHELRQVDGGEVAIRDLTPNCLHGFFLSRGSGTFRIVDALSPRPQDFPLVLCWLPAGTTFPVPQADFEAAVAAGDSSVSTSMTSTADIPTGAGLARVLAFGVPLDAPDIESAVGYVTDTGIRPGSIARWTPWDGFRYGGTAYKWWYGTTPPQVDGNQYRVTFIPYS